MEFNPDGSIKLPTKLQQQNDKNVNKLLNQKCIEVRREIVSDYAPKKCNLNITLSKAIHDTRFITNIYEEWKKGSQTPSDLIKHNDKEFTVIINTNFKRCTDCNKLINTYREFLYSNLIDKKGTCTFEGFKKNFHYEDYFD
jgi:hypothetical protein